MSFQTRPRSFPVVYCFNYGKVSAKDEVPGPVITGGTSTTETLIAQFENVFYLKSSGGRLFNNGAANANDGWGTGINNVTDKIIERTADEFSNGELLTLLNTQPDSASDAYNHYEEDAWTQYADYPVLAEINMPDRGKSAINAAIAKAEDLLSEPYTAASLAAMASALSAARDVAYDESLLLTRTEVDEAANALLGAIAALEPIETVKIGSAGDLTAFAARVNAGEHRLNGRLVADIVAEPKWSAIGAAWSPVEYEGVFDGCGHTITLKVTDVNASYIGLFHTIAARGVVKNLALVVDFVGNNYVGGVAGLNKGRIERVSVSGTIESAMGYAGGIAGGADEGSTISRCVNYANVSAYDSPAGGIAGGAKNSIISRCVNYANVSAHGTSGVGGIAGSFFGTMEYSANHGGVECASTASGGKGTGGLIGNSSGAYEISNCYNVGDVAVLVSNNGLGLGGLLGYTSLASKPTLVNCFNYGRVTYQDSNNALRLALQRT